MNKSDLAERLAADHDLPKHKAVAILDTVTDTITQELVQGREVRILGFGKFSTRQQAARTMAANGFRGAIDVPAKTVPKFTPAKQLRAQVNGDA